MDKLKESFNKLSSREKILIYILINLIIVSLGWLLLIEPQLNRKQTLNTTKETYQLQLDELLNTNVVSTKNINQLREELNELNNSFYSILTKEDIDQLITDLSLNHKLSPSDLVMSDIQEVSLNEDDTAKIQTCVAQQVCSGSESQLLKLLDDVKAMDGIDVTGLSYGTSKDTYSITYTIYMVEK